MNELLNLLSRYQTACPEPPEDLKAFSQAIDLDFLRSDFPKLIASMEAGGSYNQTDAEGFLRIMGLPSRVQGRVRPRAY